MTNFSDFSNINQISRYSSTDYSVIVAAKSVSPFNFPLINNLPHQNTDLILLQYRELISIKAKRCDNREVYKSQKRDGEYFLTLLIT